MMIKKIVLAAMAAMFMLASVGASAEPVVQVLNCKLSDGKTSDDAHALNAKWLKWAHAKAGTDEITSSFVTTMVGELNGFMWVDTYPSLAVWAKIADLEFEDEEPEISAAFDELSTCTNSRLLRSEQSVVAK